MKIDITCVDAFLGDVCGDDGVVGKWIDCCMGLFERVKVRWVVTISFETWESRTLVGPLGVLWATAYASALIRIYWMTPSRCRVGTAWIPVSMLLSPRLPEIVPFRLLREPILRLKTISPYQCMRNNYASLRTCRSVRTSRVSPNKQFASVRLYDYGGSGVLAVLEDLLLWNSE